MRKTVVAGMALVLAGGLSASGQTTQVAKSWADKIKFTGDLRYRFETIDDQSKLDAEKNPYTRERERIRARIGAEATCDEDLRVGIGVSTGGADPISGMQTLGDGDTKKEVRLDVAYLDYSGLGDASNGVRAIAGKMYNPFIQMNDDLIWDPDLRPEGMALQGQLTRDWVTFYANAGYLWVQERDSLDALMLYAGQTAVKAQFVPTVALTVGAACNAFQGLRGANVIDWQNANNSFGNSTLPGTVSGSVTNKAWATDFVPVMGFAQLDLLVAGLPVALFSQHLVNGEAAANNRGQMYGVTLGKAKKPCTWEVGYSYAKLEKDATLGMWTDSERWGGGTDAKGHRVTARYQIMKYLQAGVIYYNDQRMIADASKTKDYDRLQIELTAAF